MIGMSALPASYSAIAHLAEIAFEGRVPLLDALPLAASAIIGAAGPTLGGALFGYAVSTAAQLGWPPALMAPKVDLSRIGSPQALLGFISPKAGASRLLKSVAKLLVVGIAAVLGVRSAWTHFDAAPVFEARALIDRLAEALSGTIMSAGGALGALAIGDYLLARRRIGADMRMTPEEMKREMREQDGDPQIKRRRRQRMMEIAKRRVGAAVKSADVVLVNPTEYAVALRYRSKKDRAPKVVAKGRGAAAEHIRELARAHGVPIVPNIPLARGLFKLVPEGREVPAQLYKAVAEILAYVYRLRRRSTR